MATLYYNNATEDNAWDTLANWWQDETFTTPASSLPATNDTVHLYGGMNFGPSIPVTLAHIYSYGGWSTYDFSGASGDCTFNNSGIYGNVYGNCTFNGSVNYGNVYGNCTFNSSDNSGTIYGNCTFNNSSIHYGNIDGNCTFNDYSYNYDGNIGGNCTFNDYSYTIWGGISGISTYAAATAVLAQFQSNTPAPGSAFRLPFADILGTGLL